MSKEISQIEFFDDTGQRTATWYRDYRESTWTITVREHGCNYWTWVHTRHSPTIGNALYFMEKYEKKHRKQDQE